jgi:pSer/pThr/pTyr-binding forkhead associated (FHA) protein
MSNSLNTPVEALEHAYPFRVVHYGIRRGSGGEGLFRGGDGLRRDIQLLTPQVSRYHAMVMENADGFEIFDMESKNGVFVNNEQVFSRQLADGDHVMVGDVVLLYEAGKRSKRRSAGSSSDKASGS